VQIVDRISLLRRLLKQGNMATHDESSHRARTQQEVGGKGLPGGGDHLRKPSNANSLRFLFLAFQNKLLISGSLERTFEFLRTRHIVSCVAYLAQIYLPLFTFDCP
jgi:hypothetical protein